MAGPRTIPAEFDEEIAQQLGKSYEE